MLHPVGDRPAAVYWRRRAVVLVLLLAVLGGAVWLTVALVDRAGAGSTAAAGPTTPSTAATPPALERVLPSLAGVRTPATAPRTPLQDVLPRATPRRAVPPAPAPGGPCTDEMIEVAVRTPGSVAAGSKPTFELVVENTAAVPCARDLDKELQELVLVDGTGRRVWGSNDCFPETTDDRRTLEPGRPVTLPLVWGGLTSEPTCTAERVPPPPGDYVVRGRLGTEASADAPLLIT